MAFGNGVLMRGPNYWAWATEDKEVAYARVRTLNRGKVSRIPILRSLVSLAEMIVLMVSLHRRNGLRRGARLLAFFAVAFGCDVGLSFLMPHLISNYMLANLAQVVVVFGLGIGALRLGLGKTVWRYHGAEHKAVNAYEGGADLGDLDEVARFSRVHDRCGTNLAVIALALILVSFFVLQSLPFWLGGIYSLVVIAVALEFFRLIGRRPRSRASRVFLSGGRALQRAVTTAEPAPQHLRMACDALRRLTDLEAEVG
jgi:uncharacterized protein YqhQ